ncbi:tRNA lysidine(34) synthetase TilS [Bacillus massiliglaciei]|uniref:tRNA lysidine(34) synthetase TilS n=1 Tax=Bacillus massiliglaciei TaxID=1816693 RepID=UPI000AB5FD15|nr:tRNA lysidine(34) synthetase TilS [Bacillus massiliglaciei]
MLKETVLRIIEGHGLIKGHSRLLVGVSGGPDSLALLHFLKEVQPIFQYELHAAHVDHMFRGEESYQDLIFAEKICEKWGIPFSARRADVPAYMEQTGMSSQTAARKVRYDFYKELMDEYEMDTLVLGHHGDDQIETILMRLTRGASGKARAGIPLKRPFHSGQIIRPFLAVTKQDIEAYNRQHHLTPRLDPSNEKNDYMRNRFRHEVLPFLKQENRRVHEHFQRFSEELQEDEDYLQEAAAKKMEGIWLEKSPDVSSVKIDALLEMPKPLQRRAIQLILNYLYPKRPSSLSAIHIEQLAALFINPQPSAELHLPEGLIAGKSYQTCIFRFSRQQPLKYSLSIQIPGETFLPNGYKIKAHYMKEESPNTGGNDSFDIPAQLVSLPLTVRTRRDGDRMKVKGLGGTKKLKKIFIDEKVPLAERNDWPVIIDSRGEILWVPALRKSEWGEASSLDESSYIHLSYEKA